MHTCTYILIPFPTKHIRQPRYFPGFARKEHDAEKGESWSIWETDAEDYNARFLGPKAGWFATVDGNRHQAMWMATREQVWMDGCLWWGVCVFDCVSDPHMVYP
jgi:hypothetical protein